MEFRLALRALRRRPVVGLAAIASIALATAAVSALFSILDGLLFRPPPFRDPGRVLVVDYRRSGGKPPSIEYLPELAGEREALSRRLAGSPLFIEAAQARTAVFFDPRDAESAGLRVQGVDDRFFGFFGLSPLMGRTFVPADARVSSPLSAITAVPLPIVIGSGLATRLFGSAARAIGPHDLAGRRVLVVGVMGPEVKFPGETNVWAAEPSLADQPPTYVRLRPSGTLGQAAAEFPGLQFQTLDSIVHPGKTGALPLLLAAGLALLVITWIQVAGLALSDGLRRLPEIGLRIALGADRTRLIHAFAIQGVAAAAVATALAWLLVPQLTAFVVTWLPSDLSHGEYLRPDLRTLAFCSVVSLVGVTVIGAAGLGVVRRSDPIALLGGRFSSRPFRIARLRQGLLLAQVAVTALILHLCGLSLRSFADAVTFNYGFDAGHVLVFQPRWPSSGGRTPVERRTVFLEVTSKLRLSVERLAHARGVGGAASFFRAPLGIGNQAPQVAFRAADGLPISGPPEAYANTASADFINALGASLVTGGRFADSDYSGRDDVMIVNESLARKLAPSVSLDGRQLWLSAIGRRLKTPDGDREVIGVIKDFVDAKLGVPAVPQWFDVDRYSGAASVVLVRCAEPLERCLPAVRDELTPIWGPLETWNLTLMSDRLAPVLAPYRGQAFLLGLTSLSILPIVVLGLWGAVSYSVQVRAHETAVRLAMGASVGAVRAAVVRSALLTTVGGLVAGVGAAILTARLVAHQLFGVHPADSLTIAGVAASLLVVAWLAALVPARRASRSDPSVLLRDG